MKTNMITSQVDRMAGKAVCLTLIDWLTSFIKGDAGSLPAILPRNLEFAGCHGFCGSDTIPSSAKTHANRTGDHGIDPGGTVLSHELPRAGYVPPLRGVSRSGTKGS